MELFIAAVAITGLATMITAIDEYINWLPSYQRAAQEMAEEDEFRYPRPTLLLNIVSEFKPFMDRGPGSRWKSLRRYLFGKNRTSGEYTTEFVIESHNDEDEYRITWSGKTEGEMDLILDNGNQLKRSRSYFNPEDGETYQDHVQD